MFPVCYVQLCCQGQAVVREAHMRDVSGGQTAPPGAALDESPVRQPPERARHGGGVRPFLVGVARPGGWPVAHPARAARVGGRALGGVVQSDEQRLLGR